MDDVFYQPEAFGPYGQTQDRTSDQFYNAYGLSSVPLDHPSKDPFYNSTAYRLAQAENAWNADQVKYILDRQERWANSSLQRGVADARAAGLNPAILYDKGGAATPSGTSAPTSSTTSAYAAYQSNKVNQGRNTNAAIGNFVKLAASAMALAGVLAAL